jgi:hypothetical protein
MINVATFQEFLMESEGRIPRKKGQPAGSDKHSDLYTDENPKGTIKGLGFKDAETARRGIKIVKGAKTTTHTGSRQLLLWFREERLQ